MWEQFRHGKRTITIPTCFCYLDSEFGRMIQVTKGLQILQKYSFMGHNILCPIGTCAGDVIRVKGVSKSGVTLIGEKVC